MLESLNAFVAGAALAVLAACLAAPVLKRAIVCLRRQGLVFALIAAGFLSSMATKPPAPTTVTVEIAPPASVPGLVYTGGDQTGVTNVDARATLVSGVTHATAALVTNAVFALPAATAGTNFVWKGLSEEVRTDDLSVGWSIARRAVTLRSADATKVRDGTPLTAHEVSVAGGSFAAGESFVYAFSGSQTEVGSSPNAFDFSSGPGTDARNYDVTKVEGTLTVTAEPPPPAGEAVAFATNAVVATEGAVVAIAVRGGSATKPTQVTVSLQKNTLTSFTSTYGVDAKGNAKRCSFPLVLSWDAGDTEPKYIGLATKAATKKEADRFLTLQLGSEVNFGSVGTDVCTVTVVDAMADPPLNDPYVRALAWPANGGRVSGFGKLSVSRTTGLATRGKTLTARASRWAAFAGWYRAKAADAGVIDLTAPVAPVRADKPTQIAVGVGMGRGEVATYFAYFTNVTAVAAVEVPDAAAPGAAGVVCGDGAYVGTVGVKFALPVGIADETGKGTLAVSGLPRGLSYDRKTGFIRGVPTATTVNRSGVDVPKSVKFVAKNAAGSHALAFDFSIEAMPAMAVGTFAGVVSDDAGGPSRPGCGAVTFTAGKTGALSAKVTTRLAGARGFSAKGYDRIDACTFGIAMTNRTREVFEARLVLTNGLFDTALEGEVSGGEAKGTPGANGEGGTVRAIRNAFLKSDGNREALEILSAYKGEYAARLLAADGSRELGTVTYEVGDNGSVRVKAKIDQASADAKTFSGTVAGGFAYDRVRGEAGLDAALRSKETIWSCAIRFDGEAADGAARYVRPDAGDAAAVLDEDQVVAE